MKALDIIRSLPIKDDIKSKIVNNFDNFTPSQRSALERVAWLTYDALYENRLNENISRQYDDVKAGSEDLGGDFYKRALQKTDKEMTVDFKESISKHDLAEARKAMEFIVKEMQATKKIKMNRRPIQ